MWYRSWGQVTVAELQPDAVDAAGANGAGMAFEFGVDAQRRESPLEGGTDHGALARATLRW